MLRTRCLELQSIDPATLDDGEFRAHLARLEARFHDGKVLHFGQNPASAVPVGDLVAHVEEWTGAPPARVAAALQGHNPSSAQTLPFLDAIAAAIRDVPGLAADFDAHDGTAIDRLHLLRNASPEVTALQRRSPPSWPPSPRSVQRRRATHLVKATHAFHNSSFQTLWP